MPPTKVDLNARGDLPEATSGTITERRREVVLAVLRRQSGASVGDLLVELMRVHAAGGWPSWPDNYGRNDPYSGGLTQHLGQLMHQGRAECVENGEGGPMRYRAVGRPRLICPLCGEKREAGAVCCGSCREGRARSLLPPVEFVDVIRDFRDRTGLEVLFGVTEDFVRVIRIGMPRGVLEHILNRDETWDDAVEEMELR